jgi:Tfp pilus assembly protein PilO
MISNTIIQIILIVVSAVIVATYVKPTFENIKSTQDETKEYKIALDNAQMFAAELAKLQSSADNLTTTQRSKLEKFLPATTDDISVMRDIKTIVLKNNLLLSGLSSSVDGIGVGSQDVTNVQFDEEGVELPLEGPEISSKQFDVNMRGTYDSFKLLLADLESNDYLLEVKNLTLAPEDDEFYNFEMTLETYSLKLAE